MHKRYSKFVPVAAAFLLLAAAATGCSSTSIRASGHTNPSPVASSVKAVAPAIGTVTCGTEAQKLLSEGNKRYTSGKTLNHDLSFERRKDLSANGQHPFAVVVGCSDSRVPPEIIFDQALGDIFVVRDAGNVVDPVSLGSIEYGAEHLGCPLIVVLGHEKCGAVKATVDGGKVTGNIKFNVEDIKPALEKARKEVKNKSELYEKCADENIKNTLDAIEKSPAIKELIEKKKVNVVGAKYHIETGEVTFFK